MPIRRIFLLVCAAALLAGCGKDDSKPGAVSGPAASGSGGGSAAKKAFDVVTSSVETRRVTYEIEALGNLIEENRFEIPARVAGVADQVKFAEGQAVTTGQQLCRIDYERYALQVAQAESELEEKQAAMQRAVAAVADVERSTSAALETARVNLELAQVEFKRRADRGANAFTSPEERDQFEAKFRQAQNAYRDAVGAASTQVALALAQSREAQAAADTARAMLALAKDNLERSIVKAPIAGVVQQRSIVEGQFVDQGDMVALMVQSDPLRLRFTVPESRASRLSRNMDITFTVPAYPESTFSGSVYDVGAFVDPQTLEVICWAHVGNPDEKLKPGFFAHVDLQVESRSEAVVVPLGAVLPTEHGMTAYVIEDGIAVRRAVETGLHVTGDAVEVLSGLNPGEQLVVEGMNALQDGVPVRVIPGGRSEINVADKAVSATSEQKQQNPKAGASNSAKPKASMGVGG